MDNRESRVFWTSPSGKSFSLKTDSTGYKQKHIGEVRENPKAKKSTTKKIQDVSDTFKDLGMGGKDLSLKFFFIGEKHVEDSLNFEKALCERGKSSLKIPYRDAFTVNVIDFETSNDLKIVNQTVITVNFHQTAQTKFPTAQTAKKKAIVKLSNLQTIKLSENIEKTTKSLQTEARKTNFIKSFSNALEKVNAVLTDINDISVKSIMADILGQDILSNAGTITNQLHVLFRRTSQVSKKISNFGKFDLSGNNSVLGVLSNLLNSLKSKRGKYSSAADVDNFVIDKTFGDLIILAQAETTTESDFATRKDAVSAATELKKTFDDWQNWADDEQSQMTDLSTALTDDNGLRDIVNSATNAIIEDSYNLKVEKKIILTESEAIYNLAYKYYAEDFAQNPEDTVNYLIQTNNFTDDKFFYLERGQTIKIYV